MEKSNSTNTGAMTADALEQKGALMMSISVMAKNQAVSLFKRAYHLRKNERRR